MAKAGRPCSPTRQPDHAAAADSLQPFWSYDPNADMSACGMGAGVCTMAALCVSCGSALACMQLAAVVLRIVCSSMTTDAYAQHWHIAH